MQATSKVKRNRAKWLLPLLLLPLAACQPQVLPTTPHIASDPTAIKIFQTKPAHYEDLGTLTIPIPKEIKWDEKGAAKPAYDLMRKKVAELGGNGILLEVEPELSKRKVLAGDGEKFYNVSVVDDARTVIIKAIFVPEKYKDSAWTF